MQATRSGLDRGVLVLGGVVVLGMILAILDATIVNVAVPTLGNDLHTSIATVQWVLTAYLLALATTIPLTSWASARFGAKRVWLAALALFTLGSCLAGAAWSIDSLIAFRVLQGAGAGLVMPVGQAILAQAAGPERIGRVMSVVGVPMLIAPILGPVIGGAIVGAASWRWIFFVNLPVAAAAMALAARLLPAVAPRHEARLDRRGLLLLPPGLALAVFGLSKIGAAGTVGAEPLALVAAGLVLVGLFVAHARTRGADALVDVSLFVRRGFAAASATTLVLGIALFGALILLPLYYQLVRGESPLRTGLLLVPQAVGAALAMPFAGRLTDEVGARLVIPAGIVLALAGTGVYTQLDAHSSYALLGGALFLIGLGLGTTVMPSMAVAYQSVPREAAPHATAAINVVQRIAGSLGTALLAVVLQRSIASRMPGFDGSVQEAARSRAAGALAGAFGTPFWVAFGLVAAALVPALLLPRAERRREPPAVGARYSSNSSRAIRRESDEFWPAGQSKG
jgi:EmrB/QacA subfamily drug resistance transporter